MDSDLVAALCESARHVLWTTMQLHAEIEGGCGVAADAGHGELIIESNQCNGWRLTLAARAETVERFASLFSGRDASEDHAACTDAMGELASMILAHTLAGPTCQFDHGVLEATEQRRACVEVCTEYGDARVAVVLT
ncbi:MAG: hypothetical protein RIE77_11345 [Phycisphaerales bacterium]|jgi:hypothetical protein